MTDLQRAEADKTEMMKDMKKSATELTSKITTNAEVEDLRARLAAMEKEHAPCMKQIASLREQLAGHDASSGETDALRRQVDELKSKVALSADSIAALRKQIKETKDALELDDGALHVAKAVVEAETIELEKHLQTRVKSAAANPQASAKGSRVKLGAGAPSRGGKALPLPLPSPASSGEKASGTGLLEFEAMDGDGDGVLSKEELKRKLQDMGWSVQAAEQTFAAMDRDNDGRISRGEFAAFCGMTDKRLEADTLSGIAKLRQELAAKNAQVKELKSTSELASQGRVARETDAVAGTEGAVDEKSAAKFLFRLFIGECFVLPLVIPTLLHVFVPQVDLTLYQSHAHTHTHSVLSRVRGALNGEWLAG